MLSELRFVNFASQSIEFPPYTHVSCQFRHQGNRAKAQKMRESINIASTTAASNFYFLSQFLIFTFFSYTRRCVYNNSRRKNTHDFQFSFVLISIFSLTLSCSFSSSFIKCAQILLTSLLSSFCYRKCC